MYQIKDKVNVGVLPLHNTGTAFQVKKLIVKLAVELGGITVINESVHNMLLEDTFGAGGIFQNAFRCNGVQLHNILDHFPCTRLAYLAGFHANALKTVGLARSIA